MDAHAHVREHRDSQSLSFLLVQQPSAPALARRQAHDFLRTRLEKPELADVLLAVSELVTNASKFGSGHPVWLHLLVSPRRLVVTVTSSGSGGLADRVASGQAADAVPLSSEKGRGLGIVAELFDDVAVSCGHVTVVRAAKDLGSARRQRPPVRVGDRQFAYVCR